MRIYIDTETCGLHGMPVLIQYAIEDGPIEIHDIWTQPIYETLKLIEMFCENEIVGFNLAFDWFMLSKIYTTFLLYPDSTDYPIEHVDEIAILEEKARFSDVCIKPQSACDLMLHARKGPYQSTMDRSDVRIKRVPTALAWQLAAELEKRVPLKDIYFARRKDKTAEKFKVMDIEDIYGDIDPNFKDILLRFAPSSALKALAVDALNLQDDPLLYSEVGCNVPVEELGFAPFALAIGTPEDWKGAWPEQLHHYVSHWSYNELARQYANKDIEYTRNLYKHFGSPDVGDDDSILAITVACVRWRGYKINVDKIKALIAKGRDEIGSLPEALATAPHVAKRYIEECLDETEKLVIAGSTKKIVLEEIAKWKNDDGTPHPAAIRANHVLTARKATKRIEMLEKLLKAGRFHASFKVIGTLSSRMAGADDFNPQGVDHSDEVRECFELADDPFILCGGDMDSFEVTLADAEYGDPKLRADLQSGKKIHALFGETLFEISYEEVMQSKGSKDDKYSKGKQGVFAMIYGGDANTLANKLGVELEIGNEAYNNFIKRYPKIGESRRRTFDAFCSMRQPGGIGTNVEWHEPADYVESMLGFRRYFTLENMICKALYELASEPPESWKNINVKVVRRDRTQTACGAVRSALYGAAFQMQAANMRAAANHRIQSTGAQITKRVERRIWDIQPAGIGPWFVVPMNVHDEVLTPTKPEKVDAVSQVVKETVESYRSLVPLIGIKWKNGLPNWSEK